ncbi:hypothetical protein T261_03235 [Streptomyces lydicus]|nr:hypothetical protein T261_03235 [Streptomyces lydicus]
MPKGLELPSFDPFDKQELRLDRAVIPEDDKAFLRKRWRELRDKYNELRFETPKGPGHGDAHVQNLMVDDQGQVILIDFEAFCFDHPEWDLMVTSVEPTAWGGRPRSSTATSWRRTGPPTADRPVRRLSPNRRPARPAGDRRSTERRPEKKLDETSRLS